MDYGQQQHNQGEQASLPVVADVPPREALDLQAAVQHYYHPSNGVTVARAPGDVDIAAAHRPALTLRTWQRRKHDLKCGKWGGRDWLETWPLPDGWHPSWEQLAPDVATDGDHHEDNVVLIYEETYARATGKLVERRLIKTVGHLAAAVFFLAWCGAHFMHLAHI